MGITLLKALIIGLMISIVYADFKTRTIAVWQLLAMGVCFLAWGLGQYPFEVLIENTILNFSFLAVQMLLLWGWLAIKERRLTGFLDRYIGIGDLLFILLFSLLMPLQQFMWFYTASIVGVLLFVILAKLARPNSFQTVPLAGGLAVCTIVYFFVKGRFF
jgi:hypothetical protein